jgi:SH3-like domain-containing protein
MRFPVPALWIVALLTALGPLPAGAQTGSLLGTSKVPAGQRDHDQPGPEKAGQEKTGQDKSHGQTPKAPAAAPRTPVQGGKKTPVVPPHGQTHPQKPNAAAAPAKPVPVPAPTPPAPSEAEPKSSAEKLSDPEKPEGTAAKLPRFASLRSDEVNMRAGPGARYRIDWVYRRRDLPVEIEREFDVWRWVGDADGIHGWVHQATLMGRRSFIVQKADATLRADASDSASAVAILKPGVVGRIRSCPAGSDWCNVSTGSYRGYLKRTQFWGLLPGEVINP